MKAYQDTLEYKLSRVEAELAEASVREQLAADDDADDLE